MYYNDNIMVVVPNLADTYKNKYILYKVFAAHKQTDPEVLYTGRLYYTGSGMRISLNNILKSANSSLEKDLNDLRMPSASNSRDLHSHNFPELSTSYPQDLYNHISIKFYDIKTGKEIPSPPINDFVFYGYPRNNLYKTQNILPPPWVPTTSWKLYNYQSLMDNILPRIPNVKNIGANFYFSFTTITPTSVTSPVELVGKKGDSYTTTKISIPNTMYNRVVLNYTKLEPLLNENPDSLYLRTSDGRLEVKVAEVDNDCPSEYYVVWYDRLGCYQCQPFNKKSTTSENIETSLLSNDLEQNRPYNKKVTEQFELNTDWITEFENIIYEGILISPRIYLFNTKTNTGVWCISEGNNWIEKKYKNQTKLFNFHLILKADAATNMIY